MVIVIASKNNGDSSVERSHILGAIPLAIFFIPHCL